MSFKLTKFHIFLTVLFFSRQNIFDPLLKKFINTEMLYLIETDEEAQENEKKKIKGLLEDILTKENYNSHINVFENSAKEKLEMVIVNSIVKSKRLDFGVFYSK